MSPCQSSLNRGSKFCIPATAHSVRSNMLDREWLSQRSNKKFIAKNRIELKAPARNCATNSEPH